MGLAVRTVVCTTCGAEMTGRYRPVPPYRCLECGIAAHVQAVNELANHSGPAYEAWLAGQVKAGERAKRQLRAKR